jgi:hypothetical protein
LEGAFVVALVFKTNGNMGKILYQIVSCMCQQQASRKNILSWDAIVFSCPSPIDVALRYMKLQAHPLNIQQKDCFSSWVHGIYHKPQEGRERETHTHTLTTQCNDITIHSSSHENLSITIVVCSQGTKNNIFPRNTTSRGVLPIRPIRRWQ